MAKCWIPIDKKLSKLDSMMDSQNWLKDINNKE